MTTRLDLAAQYVAAGGRLNDLAFISDDELPAHVLRARARMLKTKEGQAKRRAPTPRRRTTSAPPGTRYQLDATGRFIR